MNSTILNSYSGIKTHQFGLDNISNNIANVNTTGYRESRAEFETLFAPKTSNNGPTSNEVNLGVSVASNAISTKSGSYRMSDGEFDLAYEGKGWFVVGDNKEGEMEVKKDGFTQKQQNFFTRNGNFNIDAQGYLVNQKGYYVYGINLGKIQGNAFITSPKEDETKLAGEKLSPLQIPQNLYFKPKETTEVKLAVNLSPTQDPSNAYSAFLENGKINEEKVLNTDLDIFFSNQVPLDPLVNQEAKITLKTPNGEEKSYTFIYSKEPKENGFKTIKELQALIKNQTGLELKVSTRDSQSLYLEIAPTSFTQTSIQTSGSFFNALGMSDIKETQLSKPESYNPSKDYSPNELVSYLGITFRKINQAGATNPIDDPRGWEIADTQNVPAFENNKTYQAGEVVKREGNIYLMDSQNQFLKIGKETTFAIPPFNPNDTYPNDALVTYNDKIYQRISQTSNANPQEDPTSWKEISLGSIASKALEVPQGKSSVEIFDEEGKKYQLVSQYQLIHRLDSQNKDTQEWKVTTYIQDLQSGGKITEVVEHSLKFDENNQPITEDVELDFKGKKIVYNVGGTDNEKSSNKSFLPSEILASSQNGNSEGILERSSIDSNGVIVLKFSNGKQEAMGRIGIVAFTNDQGLSKMSGNLFGLESTLIGGEKQLKSGNPILGWNEEGNLTMGNVKQGYLETSNVDVGNALTELILMQRGYAMNAKSFTTGDEMIKEAINLKK